MGATLPDEIHEQPVERLDFHVQQLFGRHAHHLDPLFQGQNGVLLRICGNRHIHLVEETQASGDQVHVPVGDRVERARVDADFHAGVSSRTDR